MSDTRPPSDDALLVAALGQGDAAAMDAIMRAHRDAVHAFARRIVGDDARAEEITQEVFVRLWQRWERFDGSRGSLRAFLLAMTHGRSLDLLRSDSARTRRETADARFQRVQPVDPASQAVAADLDRRVRAAMAVLSPEERRAVELAYFHGHSYRAVAELVGDPEGTVKSRIRRSLAKLRQELAAQSVGA